MANNSLKKITNIYDEIEASGYKEPKDIIEFLKQENQQNKEDNIWNTFLRNNLVAVGQETLQNREKYKEMLLIYKELLEDYKKLVKELNIEESIDIATLYANMLWNGYFSINKEHNYDSTNATSAHGLLFSDVILGRGVCLAYADLLKDILNTCNKESQVIECTMKSSEFKEFKTYKPQIPRKLSSNEKCITKRKKLIEKLTTYISNRTGNHAITLIDDPDKTYLFDPTTLTAQNFISPIKTSVVDGIGGVDIKYFMTAITNPFPKNNIIAKKDFEERIKRRITTERVIESFKYTTETTDQQKELIEDSYKEISPKLDLIGKMLVKEK